MSEQPDPNGGPIEVSPLLYRLADSIVLIGVRTGDRGPEPLYTDVSGTLCAVAYTDPDEIRRDLPDGYRLFQITVPELLAQLPPAAGLIVNPRAASPIHVAADERDVVIAAGRPFPAGAFIKVKASADAQPRLLAAVLPRLAALPAVRRLFLTRYRVADAREKILAVYEVDGTPGADEAAADAVTAAAAEIALADPMQVVALGDVPEELRAVVLADVDPAWVRAEPPG
ncbi:hypothetical protein ABZ721_24815 [Streptomyces sp. NPDC006733]|uniref:hypothetical protein n=1 Tax=Streptomyces sp. NPDC006733 TaxID=3155460 RepID=UPI0033C801DB